MKDRMTLGQYYQTDSVLHRLDPRVKLTAGNDILDICYSHVECAGEIHVKRHEIHSFSDRTYGYFQSLYDAGRAACKSVATDRYQRRSDLSYQDGCQTSVSDHGLQYNDAYYYTQ